MVENDIADILISKEQIANRIKDLAKSISTIYSNDLIIVAILKGSMIFVADLIRCLPTKMKIGIVNISSYKLTERNSPKLIQDIDIDIKGKHVLLVDDIFDSGATLKYLRELFNQRQPASLRTCVLLSKSRSCNVDFVGFYIKKEFVVGYGLDYNGYYRNYPHIAILKEEKYEYA